MNLSVEIGNGYIKFANGRVIPATVKLGKEHNTAKTKHIPVNYKGIDYVVGSEDGARAIGENKYDMINYEVLLMTAITQSTSEDFIECGLVVNMPFVKYTRLGEYLKKKIERIGQQKIIANGTPKTIRIKKCEPFTEGALPYLLSDLGEEEKVMVIDMGYGDINISEWDGVNIADYDTYPLGMTDIYAQLAKELNEKEGLGYLPPQVKPLLNKRNIVVRGGETIDITWMRDFVQNHIDKVASFINGRFNINQASRIYLIGGGGMDTERYWENVYPNIRLFEEAQHVNAKVLELVKDELLGEVNE